MFSIKIHHYTHKIKYFRFSFLKKQYIYLCNTFGVEKKSGQKIKFIFNLKILLAKAAFSNYII